MELAGLAGWTVGVTADRRREEQAELLRRRGAKVVHGPTVRTLPVDLSDGLEAATEAVIAEPPDIVVLHTALGTRAWFEAAESTGRADALRAALGQATVVARGPKASGAAVTAGIRVAWQAPSETSAAIFDQLRSRPGGLEGVRIAVQRDGSPEAYLADALAQAGADAIDVPVYRWQLPDDPEPAERLICAAIDRQLDAVTFTSTPAVEGLVGIAEQRGVHRELLDAFAGGVVAVSVGPVCSTALRRAGITSPVQPGRSRVGAMVQALLAEARRHRREVVVGTRRVVLQGAVLSVAQASVELSRREHLIIRALAARPGAVVAKAELLRSVWGRGDGDPHLVEVAVARVRGRLDTLGLAVEAVPRRGYRLVPA